MPRDTIVSVLHDKGAWHLEHGDCVKTMKRWAAEGVQVDAIVTDPPFMLNFMGKSWDKTEGIPAGVTPFAAWLAGFCAGEACFRVQQHKNGGYYTCTFSIHLRADDSPVLRELHRRIGGRLTYGEKRISAQNINCNPDCVWIVETKQSCLALANILDCVPLFAKKARDYVLWRRALQLWIDTPRGNKWGNPRDVNEISAIHKELQNVKRFDSDYADLDFNPFMPPMQSFHYEWARAAYDLLKPGAYMLTFGGTKTWHRLASGIEDAGFLLQDTLIWAFGQGLVLSRTRLNPGWSPIVMARKPGPVLDLNIDACRVEGPGGQHRTGEASQNRRYTDRGGTDFAATPGPRGGDPAGRWPKNLIHDGSDEVVGLFPTAPGQLVAAKHGGGDKTGTVYGRLSRDGENAGEPRGDDGSAARFFNECAWSVDESELRLVYHGKIANGDKVYRCTPCDAPIRHAEMAAHRHDMPDWKHIAAHPTQKPVSLLRHLLRLVAKSGEVVIDPFAGSGTTLAAAVLEGMDAMGIEQSAEYASDCRHRMETT